MSVLVTGAAGFVGAHVVQGLLRQGLQPRALVRPGRLRAHLELPGVELVEGDLADERSLTAACRGARGLVHCAAHTKVWPRQDRLQRRINVEGTAALYRAAHKARVERIVHVSTVAAVGATRDGALLDEQAVWNLHALGSGYAITKRAGEERALAAAWAGMPVVVVNPAFILGPRLDAAPPPRLFAQVASGKLRLVPDGGISVTDVEDVTHGILAALERGTPGERYILAGHNLSWAQIYAAMAEVSGARAPKLRLRPSVARAVALGAGLLDALGLARPPLVPEVWRRVGWYGWYDSGKARRELGYEVRPLQEILRRTWQAGAARESRP